jgi:hypothetical protein
MLVELFRLNTHAVPVPAKDETDNASLDVGACSMPEDAGNGWTNDPGQAAACPYVVLVQIMAVST